MKNKTNTFKIWMVVRLRNYLENQSAMSHLLTVGLNDRLQTINVMTTNYCEDISEQLEAEFEVTAANRSELRQILMNAFPYDVVKKFLDRTASYFTSFDVCFYERTENGGYKGYSIYGVGGHKNNSGDWIAIREYDDLRKLDMPFQIARKTFYNIWCTDFERN